MFYSVCHHFCAGWNDIDLDELIKDVIDDKRDMMLFKKAFKSGESDLLKDNLLELASGDFFGNTAVILGEEGRKVFLGEELDRFEESSPVKDCLLPEKIGSKRLYFESPVETQLGSLRDSLQDRNFKELQRRLSDKALPTGICAIFYGSPGTGKTESVLQIAKSTGRTIQQVDISQMKSCWYGESQKLVREVFKKYRALCKKSKLAPILLFNEADAIFGRRTENTANSVDQTENAIQNIILEEMEKLDGILIATTNLAGNLDPAFERRFLYKIKFSKPGTQAKTLIWKDKLPELPDEQVAELAEAYDFSGGEIDNIARKLTIENILSGDRPTMEQLRSICRAERLEKTGQTKKIGF